MVKLEYLFPSHTGWMRITQNIMATFTCSNGQNLGWYTLCYCFIYLFYLLFYLYFIYFNQLWLWTILWRPITRKIRVAQKNVIEEKLLEIKRSIRRGMYLFQIRTVFFFSIITFFCFVYILLVFFFKCFLYLIF